MESGEIVIQFITEGRGGISRLAFGDFDVAGCPRPTLGDFDVAGCPHPATSSFIISSLAVE